jgi:hypothetical protein
MQGASNQRAKLKLSFAKFEIIAVNSFGVPN